MSIRRNDLRDLTARVVSEICKDAETEPKLLSLPGEEVHGRTKIDQMRKDWTLQHKDFGIEINRNFSI